MLSTPSFTIHNSVDSDNSSKSGEAKDSFVSLRKKDRHFSLNARKMV